MRQRATGGISFAGLSRLATRELPHVVSGLATEAAWATAHVVMYPLGLLSAPTHATTGHRRHTLRGLSPEQRGLFHYDVEAATTPILLVHGFIDNHAIFTVMERALRRRGFQTLSAYDYGLLTHNIPRAAVRLGETIEKLATKSGYERIHVIGHSLGGLIARYYVQRLGGDSYVRTLVTLGTPHHGTHTGADRATAAAGPPPHPALAGDPGASRAGTGLPYPVHRIPQRHRPTHRAQQQRPARAS